ncbi:MAG: hypothetical protein QOF25_5735 [Mycobacterium sp.]|nr:hypothetical protein [Mycobacterium sp.]
MNAGLGHAVQNPLRQHLRLTRVEIPGGQILGERATMGRLDGRVEATVVQRLRRVGGDSVGQIPFQRSGDDALWRIDVGWATDTWTP